MIRMRTLAAALLLTTTSVAFAQEGREPRGQGASPPAASQQGGGAQMQRDGGGDRGGMDRQGAPDRGAAAQKDKRGGDDNARKEAQRGGDGKKAEKQADNADKREDKAERKAGREQDKDARKEARDERKDDRKQAREERKSGDAAGNKADADKAAEGRSRGADDKRNAAETNDPRRGQQADRAGQQPSTSQQTGQSGEQPGQPGQRGQDAASAQQGAEGQRRTVELSEPDRNKVRDGFRSERSKVKHRTNVNIDITIGRRLPRDWEYYAVPTFLVEIAPRYRGYRYAWVEDRYVLIEPDTYEVVAYVEPDSGRIYESTTIAAAGTRSGGGSASAACEKVELSSDEETAILRLVKIEKTRNLDLDVGTTVPRDVELLTFPDDVLKDHRALDACRYVAVEDDKLAVISTQSRKVVAIIED